MIRFLSDSLTTAKPGDTVALSKDEAKHAKVLRVRPNEVVELLDGQGTKAKGAFSEGKVVLASVEHFSRPSQGITLVVGVTQGGTFETILSQAVEMGVSRIIPLACQNSAPMKDAKRQSHKQERWQRVLEEACKQSGCPFFPQLDEVTSFDESLFESLAGYAHWVGALTPDARKAAPYEGNLAVWIGPEGDFSEPEYAKFQALGACFISLGENVLRTQTACLAMLSLAKYLQQNS